MKNEKWYKETFDKVHVPEELLGKVMNMENQTEKKAKRGWRYAMGTLAAVFGLFVASNVVCYAATGETWVSKITFYLNGEKVERDVTWHEYEDGTLIGELSMEIDEENEQGLVFAITDDVEMINGDFTASVQDWNIPGEYSGINCTVEAEEDGSVWLRIGEDGVCKAEVDLSADLADGVAEGDLVCDGLTYHYQVTQAADGEYELMLSADLAGE